MKRTMKRILSVALVLCMALATVASVSAVEYDNVPTIRVNGYVVEFPDGKPFIDENDRTMIPVRFVGEQLGAAVSWDNDTRTAIVEKNGICVEIPIGSTELRVTENGATRTVTMDTAAVISEDRTCVPIRFVAEALGAYVDYADAFHTVGIYQDVLTAEEIEFLQAFPYTQSEGARSYETAKAKKTQEDLEATYGTMRGTFGNFANAREYLYTLKYDPSTFYAKVIASAREKTTLYNSDNLTIEFRTDASCIYQEDNTDHLTTTVRGIAVATLHVSPAEMTPYECHQLGGVLGFDHDLFAGRTHTLPLDIHINNLSPTLKILDIVPLTDDYL